MNKIIRAISLFLIFTFMLPSNSMVIAEEEECSLSFEKGIVSNGISIDFNGSIIKKDGIYCASINPDDLVYNLDMKFGGSMKQMTDGSCIELEVTYFDEGEGKFALLYDGIEGETTYPGYVKLKDSGRWKTKKYVLQNPKFSGRVSGADARISINTNVMGKSSSKVCISKVTARKTDYKSLFNTKITTNKVGNIFFDDEEVVFNIRISPIKGQNVKKESYNITYRLTDDKEKEIWSKTEENKTLVFDKNFSYKIDELKYGVYYLYMIIETPDKSIRSECRTYFTYVKKARKNPEYGACLHYAHGYPNPEWGAYLLAGAGIGTERDTPYWQIYESKKGIYDYIGLPFLQRSFQACSEYNIDRLDLAGFGNKLYNEGHRYMPETDEQIEAFAKYCESLASDPEVKYIEIWNEPNASGFNMNNVDFKTYAKILKTVYPRIKAINPNIKVIGMSLVSMPNVPFAPIDTVWEEGGFDYMDGIAIHPYMWQSSPMYDNYPKKYERLNEHLKELGYPDMEIWVTELGWGAGPERLFSLDDQAAYAVQAYVIAKSYKNIAKMYWYDFQNDGVLLTDREQMFGLINHWSDSEPWKGRPSYVAVANMNDLLSGAEFVESADNGDHAYLYHYRNDGKDIYILFSRDEGYAAALSSNKEDVTVLDLYGNESQLSAVLGTLNFITGDAAQYIIGENLELSFAEPTVKLSDTVVNLVYGESVNLNISSENENVEAELISESDNIQIERESKNNFIIFPIEQKEDQDRIFVRVEDDDKAVLEGYLCADYQDLISAYISNTLYNFKNFNRWVGTVTVTNHSLKNSIEGTMSFLEPDLFADKLMPIKIPEIKPQETKEIRFHFPEILRKEAYRLNAIIKLDSGYKKIFSDRIDFAVASYADTKPVIDGVLEDNEWVMGTAMAFDKKEQAVMLGGFSWDGVKDLSGNVCVMYDEENLYLGARVVDDVMCQEYSDNNIWQGDSIQFGVAYERANGQKNNAASTEVGIALTPDGEKVFIYNAEDISIKIGEVDIKGVGGDLAIKREENVTTYEFKMPWWMLVPRHADISGGKNLAFSMLVNDNDGLGRKGWLEYASGIGKIKNINLFTFLKLMDKKEN